MKDTALIEVSEILKEFNIDEISRIIEDQFNTNYSEDSSTDSVVDHLKPLYYTYRTLTKQQLDEDTKKDAEIRFYSVCNLFINAISKKFNLHIDHEWLDDNIGYLPGLTYSLYSFFIIDFSSNVYEVLLNYILKNTSEIYEVFEGMRNKKDSSTLANKKSLSPEMSLIISNIFDISLWIFNKMTEDEFFNYLSDEYTPLKIIKKLFNDGKISGDFIEVINEIFQSNIRLRSKTCFEMIYRFRSDNFKETKK